MSVGDFGDKPAVRKMLKERIEGILLEKRKEKSLRACGRVIESEYFGKAKVVMVYLSMPDEMDTTPIILEALEQGKTVVAPKIMWKTREMIPVRIESLNEGLVVAKLGIREPASDVAFPIERIDLTIVPAMGFSMEGHRIGHGMGFYDRFLSQKQYRGFSCGLGFEEQVLEKLPVNSHDVRLNRIVTDEKEYS